MYQCGLVNASNECMRCGSPCAVAVDRIARTENVDDIVCIARSHHHIHRNCSIDVAHIGDRALIDIFYQNDPETSTSSAFKVLSSVINWMVYHKDFNEQYWGIKFLNHIVGTESSDPCTAVVSLLQVMRTLVHDIQTKFNGEKFKLIIPEAARLAETLKKMWDMQQVLIEPQTRGRCTCTSCLACI
jgi:hypothetical protein